VSDIWSIDKLTLFIAFVLPGFISLQVYRLFVAGDDSDLVKTGNCIVQRPALPRVRLDIADQHGRLAKGVVLRCGATLPGDVAVRRSIVS
jgi:hypothetical protein